MFKWILTAGGALVLVAFIVWQVNSVKTSYVNGLEAYRGMQDRQYIFERDCYIFKLKGRSTDLPLVADHEREAALPAEVAQKYVGADLPGVRILAIAHVGDRVKVASVRREQGREGTHITLEMLFLDEDQRPYPRLDADLILDHGPEAEGKAPQPLPIYLIGAVMH
ncbi:MAG TPA: hypothetical protein VHC86_06870 [Opitutaceae bacterium]|nr:hypothetical protein [Opitutaceae bacterium]